MGFVIDGIAASEAIDSSGEILSIAGIDTSVVDQGHCSLNWEHRSADSPGASALDIVGHVRYCHKIFKEEDCKSDRQRNYWKQVELPFLYFEGELFDDEGHPGAVALAALMRFYHRRNLEILGRYSIEGSTLERDPKDKNLITRSILKAVACTVRPCNRSAFSGVVYDPKDIQDKSEPLVRFEDPTYQRISNVETVFTPQLSPSDTLKNALESLKEVSSLTKAIAAGGYDAAPTTLTGGSALQKEYVDPKMKPQVLAAIRDWDRKKPFKEFLKHRLPDANEHFLDHFYNIVDTFNTKKSEELESNLKLALRPLIKQEDGQLTEQGAQLKPNPALGKSIKFDGKNGVLYTPRGTFKVSIPSRNSQDDRKEFNDKLNSDKISTFRNAMLDGWAKLNELPSTPHSIHAHIAALDAGDTLSDKPKYHAAMCGHGNLLLNDKQFIASLFGLDQSKDAGSLAYLGHLLSQPVQQPITDFITKYYSQHHDAAHHILENPRYKAIFENKPDDIALPAFLNHWLAENSDNSFIDAMEQSKTGLNKTDLSLPQRTAKLQSEWALKYGDIPALMLYYAYLSPQLIAHNETTKIQKFEALTARLVKSSGLEPQPKQDLPTFQGHQVLPGQITVIAGPHKNHVMDFVGSDDKNFYVHDKTSPETIHKLPRELDKKQFKVESWYQHQPEAKLIDANKHGSSQNETLDQKALVHGIDMADVSSPEMGHTRKLTTAPMGWTTNASGQRVFVKPNVDTSHIGMNDVQRDMAYQKLAHEFFGLGHHIPTHAAFKDPETGSDYIAVKGINGEHVHPKHDMVQHLLNHHHSGTLDKLSIMDMILGNGDRHNKNYLLTDEAPNIHLIDHSNAFKSARTHYEPDWYRLVSQRMPVMTEPLHPAAQAWLQALDPKEFVNKAIQSGVEPDRAQDRGNKLSYLQKWSAQNPKGTRAEFYQHHNTLLAGHQ